MRKMKKSMIKSSFSRAFCFATLFLTAVCLLFGCGAQPNMAEQLASAQAQVEALEGQLASAEAQTESADAQIEKLEEQLVSADARIEDLEAQLKAVEAKRPISEIYIMDDIDGIGARYYESLPFVTAPGAQRRSLPLSDAHLMTEDADGYFMMDIRAVLCVQDYDGEWVMWALTIDRHVTDPCAYGWIRVDQLMEYTEENRALLRYPVYVTEGTVDLETGEEVFTGYDFCITELQDGVASIHAAGNVSYTVAAENLLYPPVDGGMDADRSEWTPLDPAGE